MVLLESGLIKTYKLNREISLEVLNKSIDLN